MASRGPESVSAGPGPDGPAADALLIAGRLFTRSLGIGTGGVFAWVARRAPADRVGSVAGIVGAAGGLGGFFPPLVFGATYDEADHSYTIGLVLLCITAIVALFFVLIALSRERERAKS